MLFFLTLAYGRVSAAGQPQAISPSQAQLAAEVRELGWIIYGARSEQGDWDLYVCRPDGSDQRNLTRTPDDSEFSPQLSQDGTRLLFRRLPRAGKLDNNRHGEQGVLVLAKPDASQPEVLGKEGEFSWASFDPSGSQIATLSIKGIAFVDWRTRAVLRTLPRRGFFQQMTWSPDGRWLCGVANSFGTGWSIARMHAGTGEAYAVNTVDCCTPDWFPDGTNVIFSWRPPGQKVNNGYGWTQLWRADAEGKSRSLVYAEDGRHVYGGNVSPDGRYVLFTGNMNEDGDPGNAGAPMGLMRLSDAPIIGGSSAQLRAQHSTAKAGPVLVLPSGWEPFWTRYDYGATAPVKTTASLPPAIARDDDQEPVRALANELQPQGTIVFNAHNDRGDWDLFVMQPDGSKRRKITDTAEYNEAGARFSPDGRRLLYYRLSQTTPVDNNTYGTGELVLANADGTNPQVYGHAYAWASWSPDGKQFACLTPKGIQIVDCATRSVVRQISRKGVVSQLLWSPDGKSFVGTANGLGPFWNIGCLNLTTGEITAASETERYNCTPDWDPGSRKVVYARGIIPQNGGRAELWEASLDGKQRQPLYAEAGRHIYGACVSPDGKYLLFTRSVEDLGKVDHAGTTMAIIRRIDTPMIGDDDAALRQRFPTARPGPRLDLGQGWEPHWTSVKLDSLPNAVSPK